MPDGKSLIIHSALHSDKGRLVRVDLRDGKELEVLAQDPQSDVADSGPGSGRASSCDPVTHAIQAVEFDYMHTDTGFFSTRKWRRILR